MDPFQDVFFWATIATATMFLEVTIFISRRRKRRIVYAIAGILAIILFEVPRFLIPFLPQPRLRMDFLKSIGLTVFALGLAIMMIAFAQLMKAKREGWRLQTTGIYGIVRHPMYLGDVLWALGWSLALKALYALALTPLWFFLRYCLATLEEEKLMEKYPEYSDYIRKVRWRILPFI